MQKLQFPDGVLPDQLRMTMLRVESTTLQSQMIQSKYKLQVNQSEVVLVLRRVFRHPP